MLEETGSGGFVEAEGGEKRDEAKVGEFARLLGVLGPYIVLSIRKTM